MLLPLVDRTISYDFVGPEDGPVVMFMHSLAADMGLWAEQVPALLAAGYRVLRTDLRGHGGSRAADGPYTMDALADDVIAVTDALGVERFHFVGLSIGGAIGQSLALRYPNRLYSAFLCDTQSESFPDAATHWGNRIEKLKQAGDVEGLADDTMGRWLTSEYRGKHQLRWNQIRATVAGCTVAGYIGCAQALANFNYTPRLGEVKLPVLVGCGSEDLSATPKASRKIASLFVNGRFEEFTGAKHIPNVEQGDAFNQVLLNWLEDARKAA
ncbi:alpha/beta hydrolase family protein [Paraburkholderia fungorum]|uniref:Alpha/beta hydrolase n=1 Tax=Paraburkholderia fungorum TaxID=134537 RepID=A0AAP1L6S2_9BURK|nr:alpha/beta hydrolase [Paraburkholderia fungorum]AJZ56598.1 alpha/beta hydrolase family protein [Paraburkholderia fungorum]MBB4519831.1 3-oxoadipate enol-lactonase [Paraburkholderia fungorum]MDT8843516.1 alpha/beta hydrolase [Paraburkholderia fungorum]